MSKRKKEEKKIEEQIFLDADVDPYAPIDPEIDYEIDAIAKKKAKVEANQELYDILSKTTEIHEKTTGKPAGGRRFKTYKRSKKYKKRKTTFKKSYVKRRAK